MITFTEQERSFLFSFVNDQFQDWNYRSTEGDLLQSILSKLGSVNVSFTEQENRRCQWLMREVAEIYTRIADPRLRHIQEMNKGDILQNHFFDGPAMSLTSQSILAKLEGDTGL